MVIMSYVSTIGSFNEGHPNMQSMNRCSWKRLLNSDEQSVGAVVLLLISVFVSGCATPAPVKQAVVDIDNGYQQNLTVIQQQETILNNINTRFQH